jgi:hypothetical protein
MSNEIVNTDPRFNEVYASEYPEEDVGEIKGELTEKQKRYATEIAVRVIQGRSRVNDLFTLQKMRKYDRVGFIENLLDTSMFHPSFTNDENIVPNVQRTAALHIKLMEVENKMAKRNIETEKMSIEMLNQLRNYSKTTDGEKLGIRGSFVKKNDDIVIESKDNQTIINDGSDKE